MQAKYTVVLKTLMDNPDSLKALNTALSTYPLYKRENESNTIIPDREELNRRLLNFYKYREIGFETVGRFLDELENVMCEIMPYYNEMYKTVEIMANLEDPFANVDVTETTKETRDGTATNQANTTSEVISSDKSNTDSIVENTSKNTRADTPQNSLSTIQAKDIDSVDYASDITWNKSDSTSGAETTSSGESTSSSDTTGTTTTKDTIEHTYHKKGNQGVNTYAHDMNEFRTTIIDITNKIITDYRIKELFMMVF